MTTEKQKWGNTIAWLAMVVVNILANTIPIGIGNTGEISAQYPNLFTPAPYTFAIWGIIYLLTGIFVLYQWEWFDGGLNSGRVRDRIGPWFAISCLFNIGWIFAWHYDVIWLSVIFIVALLPVLIEITRREREESMRVIDSLCVTAGFNIYFGWIIAAVIANISVLLVKIGWGGWGLGEAFWIAAILLIGAAIGFAVILVDRRILSGMSIIWAYIGIIFRHLSEPGSTLGSTLAVMAACTGIAVMICAIILLAAERKGRYDPQYCAGKEMGNG